MPLRPVFFEEVLDGEGRAQRARAEHVVAAAVSGSALDQGLVLGASRGLAQAGERVVLAEDADYRPARSRTCRKTRS